MPAAAPRLEVLVTLPSGHSEKVTPEVAQRLADELVEAVSGAAAVREVTGGK